MAGPTLFPRVGGQFSRKLSTTPRIASRKLKNFVLHSTDNNPSTKLCSSQLRSSHTVTPAKESEPAKIKVHEQTLLKELIDTISAQKAPFFCGGEVRIADRKDKSVLLQILATGQRQLHLRPHRPSLGESQRRDNSQADVCPGGGRRWRDCDRGTYEGLCACNIRCRGRGSA